MKYTLILLSLFILSSCAYNKKELPTPDGSTPPSTGGVNKTVINALASNTFSPNSVTISVGDTVEFINVGGFHSIDGTQATYPGNPVSFDNIAQAGTGWVYIQVFNTVGNYSYECGVHGASMSGTITVN